MIVPVEKGEYCPRTTLRCIGEECPDYGNPGCKIYNKRISLSSVPHAQLSEKGGEDQ